MSEYSGNIRDLPVVTGGHFIENSTKKIVFGPDGRFWDDYVMRLFTLEPGAESSIHAHAWCHWFLCGVRHNFGNTGDGELMGLCIVPPEGDVNPLTGC